MLEIRPANLAQVVSYGGKMIAVTEDVTHVAQQLQELDPCLRLYCAAEADPMYWVVTRQVPQPDGSVNEELVNTSLDLGSHIVERLRQIDSDGYDYAAELEKQDEEARRNQEYREAERRGPILEKLAYAVRKDLGL